MESDFRNRIRCEIDMNSTIIKGPLFLISCLFQTHSFNCEKLSVLKETSPEMSNSFESSFLSNSPNFCPRLVLIAKLHSPSLLPFTRESEHSCKTQDHFPITERSPIKPLVAYPDLNCGVFMSCDDTCLVSL